MEGIFTRKSWLKLGSDDARTLMTRNVWLWAIGTQPMLEHDYSSRVCWIWVKYSAGLGFDFVRISFSLCLVCLIIVCVVDFVQQTGWLLHGRISRSLCNLLLYLTAGTLHLASGICNLAPRQGKDHGRKAKRVRKRKLKFEYWRKSKEGFLLFGVIHPHLLPCV